MCTAHIIKMEIECDGFPSKTRQVGNGLSEEAWNVYMTSQRHEGEVHDGVYCIHTIIIN